MKEQSVLRDSILAGVFLKVNYEPWVVTEKNVYDLFHSLTPNIFLPFYSSVSFP